MHVGRNPLPDPLLLMVRRPATSGAGYFSGEDLVGEGSPGVHQGAWSMEAVSLGRIMSVAEEFLDGVVCLSSGAGGRIDHCMEELGWGDLKGGGGCLGQLRRGVGY